MFQLNELTKLVKKRKRVGRGGSRGGTSGRGGKGQKARTGDKGVGFGFEGGQTPLARHMPKRGFNNALFTKRYKAVNIADLERCFSDNDEVTLDALIKNRLFNAQKGVKGEHKSLVKILGSGDLTKKLVIVGLPVSSAARVAIERVGGKIINH
jgi:large subunit ribosomal protein L15